MSSSSNVGSKPPVLIDLSPQSLIDFLLSFELFFLTKNITDDRRKIATLGLSLSGSVELSAWWNGSRAEHLNKSWETFVKEFKREAFPRDYVWETEREIRNSRQKEKNYGEWSARLRNLQQTIGSVVLTDREFIKTLLYNMDEELSVFLRQHPILTNTGLHEDDLTSLGLAMVHHRVATGGHRETGLIRSTRFEIDHDGHSIPIDHKPLSIDDPNHRSDYPIEHVRGTHRQRAVVPLGHVWMHQSPVNVPSSYKPGDVIPTPPGFVPSSNSFSPYPATSTTTTTSSAPVSGMRVLSMEEELIEEEKEHAWFSDDSEYVQPSDLSLPSLSVVHGDSSSRTSICSALADSGCTSTFISDRMVEQLGLARKRLSRPREIHLAIKDGPQHTITIQDMVKVRMRTRDGLFDAGEVVFKVANLEEPYDVILGNPFLCQHRLLIHLHPFPALIRSATNDEPELDLFASRPSSKTFHENYSDLSNEERHRIVLPAVLARIGELENQRALEEQEEEDRKKREEVKARLMEEFEDRFPNGIPSVSEADKSPVRHHLRLKDPTRVHNRRGYASPARWNLTWKRLLDKHVEAGRLRLLSSPYASPSFVQPKKDPLADPRWLNDYRHLNDNTIPDRTPLTLPDEILATAAKASFWGKIDMSDAFFQTRMAEEDIEKTAVKTPWGLYEWVVMPQGLCNAPATHQRRVNDALASLIGNICFVFVDDIIIYSNSLDEDERNCRSVLLALRQAGLYCSPKKTDLVTLDTEFLGHRISRDGIGADPNKIEKVVNWTTPRTCKQLRGFLGLVQYLRKFIKSLAKQTAILTPLTRKGMGDITTLWGAKEERAFRAIKTEVTSLPILHSIDHSENGEKIWLMTDASKVGVGAVLLQGNDWKTAMPCGFYSRQFIAAEKNYPVHEQELLAVVAALKAWKIDLLGEKVTVLTDHETLKHLKTQPDLSKRQSRWLETLADFDLDIRYLPGEKNTIADGLSRFSFEVDQDEGVSMRSISSATIDSKVLTKIKEGYKDDPVCQSLLTTIKSSNLFEERDGLIFVVDENRLFVPAVTELRKSLLHDSHDSAGHFGAAKVYANLRKSYFWPGLSNDTRKYCALCDGCQRFKSDTQCRQGLNHPLPVPPRLFTDVALDFGRGPTKSSGSDMLLTITDRLSGYTRLIGTTVNDEAKKIASRFFEEWVRFFGQPLRIVSDRDKLFTSRFWKTLHRRMGSRLQMSTVFHPETDGRSERTNKTVVQVLRSLVSRTQSDWSRHLATTEYATNSATNVSTGRTPFELVLGFNPRVSPPLDSSLSNVPATEQLIAERESMLAEAQDRLRMAKVAQSIQIDAKRRKDEIYEVGDKVLLTSRDRRARYKSNVADPRAAKLFPRYNGPYEIIESFPHQSQYRLRLDPSDKSHNMFHSSKLKRYIENDPSSFPDREPPRPQPVIVGGEEEYVVEKILDEKKTGRLSKYLVKWLGYPDSASTWETRESLEETEALDNWLRRSMERT
ncbi:hypothetical protein JCM16303_003124 [Sporobolomyces ruberrimus]